MDSRPPLLKLRGSNGDPITTTTTTVTITSTSCPLGTPQTPVKSLLSIESGQEAHENEMTSPSLAQHPSSSSSSSTELSSRPPASQAASTTTTNNTTSSSTSTETDLQASLSSSHINARSPPLCNSSSSTTLKQQHHSHHTHTHTHTHHHHHHHSSHARYHHRFHHSNHHKMDIVFENIRVRKPGSNSDLECELILRGVSGYALPGQLLGIMGPSGSGKTTLLSSLAGRSKLTGGSIRLNGDPLCKQLRRKIAYVMQNDVFFTDLTLRQTLMYTALLRLPDSMCLEKKSKLVDHIIDALDLRHCQHTIIGDMMKPGLSGGEKRRLSLACELVTVPGPTVLLIDEPTSGLDSSTACSLLNLLKTFAVKEKKTLVLSIHQPSSNQFHLMDNLLLLHNGRCAYFGSVHTVVPFFNSIGFPMPPHYNPADFILDKIKGQQEDADKIISAAEKLEKLPTTSSSNSNNGVVDRMRSNSSSESSQRDEQTCVQVDEEDEVEHSNTDKSSTLAVDVTEVTSSVTNKRQIPCSVRSSNDNEERSPLWSSHGNLHPTEDEDDEDVVINEDDDYDTSAHLHHHHQNVQCCEIELEKVVVIESRKERSNSGCFSRGRDCDSGRSSLVDMDRSSTSSTFCSSSHSNSSSSSCSEEMYFDFTRNAAKSKTGCNLVNASTSMVKSSEGEPSTLNKLTSRIFRSHGSSSNRRNRKTYEAKWPTCFWTQLKVLTGRNFYEARGRMLSKLNFIQTIVLALVTGSIWYQIERREETLVDIKGWIFFSMTYWMLFALFNALVAFPAEREVILKERASGSYRLSAYYLSKMIGELPLTLAMPTIYHCISYPLMGASNYSTFLATWSYQILCSIVAQSAGLLIGATATDLEVSITVAALYSMSSILFGGFYCSTMPFWLTWLRYLSIVYYAFQNMQMLEFSLGTPILCSQSKSKFASCQSNSSSGFIDYGELRQHLDISTPGSEPMSIWINSLILLIALVAFRSGGYLVLRFLRKPK